ncbi:MAG: hypothetical protein HN417_00685 [Desulfobacula sp.]|nr:hypothetical protein [Desulfobacula sp.]MBT6338574.1 hypothetical protein [Desulfobacula sp.]
MLDSQVKPFKTQRIKKEGRLMNALFSAIIVTDDGGTLEEIAITERDLSLLETT